MGKVEKASLVDFTNGQKVQDTHLDQNFEVIRVALNDADDVARTTKANTYTKAEVETRMVTLYGGSGFIDGGSFLDTFPEGFSEIDGGEF